MDTRTSLRLPILSVFFGAAVALLIVGSGAAYAVDDPEGVVRAFKSLTDIHDIAISAPAVVEFGVGEEYFDRYEFAVRNLADGAFEPTLVIRRSETTPIPVSAHSSQVYAGGPEAMTDGNMRTWSQFLFPGTGNEERATILLVATAPIESTALTLLLDDHVALPTAIEIRTLDTVGNEHVVLARRPPGGFTVRFPRTRAARWVVTLDYAQPLRIAEIRLEQANAPSAVSTYLRFLARPAQAYRVFADPDRNTAIRYRTEPPNLGGADEDIVRMPRLATWQKNPLYVMADVDRDGVPDFFDNCVDVQNADQRDLNVNGRGDACEDFDRDGVMNSVDNCPDQPNHAQQDVDGDGIGDACDSDESRLTERHAWLPWLGMGFAAVVLVGLFAVTARSMRSRLAADEPPGDLPS